MKELHRLQVLTRIAERHLTRRRAAALLQIGERQVRRLYRAFVQDYPPRERRACLGELVGSMAASTTVIVRAVSDARFEIARRTGTSPVVLGARDDAPLLGAVTLETLGLMVNPLTREVRPMGRLPMYRAFASAGP